MNGSGTSALLGRFRVVATQSQNRLQSAGVKLEDAQRIRFSMLNFSAEQAGDDTSISDEMFMTTDVIAESALFVTDDGEFDDLSEAITSAWNSDSHELTIPCEDDDHIILDLNADIDYAAKNQYSKR